MQDQQPDSSDLNTDEDAALLPEGKAARRRHRMPRQKLRQAGAEGTDDVSVEPKADVHVEPEAEAQAESVPVAAEAVVEPEPEPEVVVEPEPEPVTRRSRFPWRRAKAAAPESTTDEPQPEVAVAEPESEPAEAAEHAESETPTVESEDIESGDPEDSEPELIMVPHRPAGRRLKAAAIVAGGLFVAAAAFAGATLQPYLVDRAEVQTKLDVARTAQAGITTLWTYTPDDMDKLDERAAKYLGGDFAKDYKEYIGRIVAANKQAQISNSTQVLGAAVESLTPTEATAIIYTNSVATSPVTKGIPSLRYLSYRLQLERRDGRWLITSMTAITSLDLTPRL
ncbi:MULTISPECIES: mammalian cell entry protein [unclassified Mycobacterium]|uniref:mammalian cell entry protein n=1 Tax=unclassified Mycobacterium TaxID=2642494 RepID=UPI0029C8BFCF|nr:MULTISPECIES: mammalian cell entry protein [unclassified Mycobacterium]